MRRPSRPILAAISVVVLLSGCGSSSSSHTAAASRTTFCADNAKLSKATAADATLGTLLSTLKANQATIDDFGRTAPGPIKAKAQLQVDGAHAAIKTNTAAAFATAKYVNAGNAINAYCRQDAKGNPVSATSTGG
ncbi:MAG: hypothetical protein M3Y09_20420 [Actinomycetota bacterium]|nr:hypothetical protein [Actinomycetota bacterium]